MAETIEEVSYNYEDEGKLVRKEMKKEVLTKGAWATVMFLYQELDRKTEAWGPPKVSIVRFKKSGGVYRKQSSFNISSEKQARQIVEVIEKWYAEVGPTEKGSQPSAVSSQPDEDHPESGEEG
ncbi:MAG TPA: hypothetical protein VHB97_11440 [Polyangia bacterium]|jgi:hypothetical protein|nr:hypothetical protein [Polyangia bacterium]